MTPLFRRSLLALALAAGLASPVFALDPGRASGSLTIDGTTTPLSFAVETRKDNLFDEKKRDVVIVLTDKQLSATRPDDEIGLTVKARRGELVAVALRIDGGTLVNVSVSRKDLSGLAILPGAWFEYTASKPGAGTLALASRDFERHSYALKVEFSAGAYAGPRQTAAPPSASPVPALAPPTPAAAQPAAPTVDRKQQTALLIQTIMKRDEQHALDMIKQGIDPNGRDQSGIAVLNWAVIMCLPPVVQALVDAKADLKYERAPGMTIVMEAGACPAAARILRAAGAR